MAFNFDSGQFNKESMPKRLGNWEVPRWAPTRARPLEMRPNPKPISDINGHFLPGAPRGTSRCFGHYTGTWELPRTITKEVAQQLAREPPEGRFPDWLNLRVQRPKVSTRMRSDKRKETKKPKEDEQSFKDSHEQENQQETENEESHDNNNPETQEDNKNSNGNFQDQLGLLEKKEPVDEDGHGPYVPGTLTDLDKRHDSYDLLNKQAIEQVHGPQDDETEKFWRKVDENAKSNEQSYDENMKYNKKSKTPKLPAVNACQNFQFARKMHVGNLEHQPLPDTLGYRNMNKIGEHRDSDIIVKPYAIGWKGYGASGPTCCTKMRVHRPKTCDLKKTDTIKDDKHRPSTSGPDLGGQNKKSMSLMDLAICWDFRPNNSKQEPKPPKHIDGSNGSKAPAVFTMVHTPKDEVEEQFVSGHSNPIFNQNRYAEDVGHHSVPYFEKDMVKEKRKDSCEVQYCPQHADGNAKNSRSGSTRRNSAQSNGNKCDGIHGCGTASETSRKSSQNSTRPDKLQPIKDAWAKDNKTKDARSRHSLESYEKTPLARGKLHQSSPNESLNDRRSTKDSDMSNNNVKHKQCISCNGTKIPQDVKQKEDYKFAFKAGNPNSVQSSASTDSKEVKVPKMRHPYTKKSYTIPTLAPPFSIWRDANATGYPEHWRLASVYQHAYKPPEQRRKPLLASVYQ